MDGNNPLSSDQLALFTPYSLMILGFERASRDLRPESPQGTFINLQEDTYMLGILPNGDLDILVSHTLKRHNPGRPFAPVGIAISLSIRGNTCLLENMGYPRLKALISILRE